MERKKRVVPGEVCAALLETWKGAKGKLRKLTIKVFMWEWLNYFGIADMKKSIEAMSGNCQRQECGSC